MINSTRFRLFLLVFLIITIVLIISIRVLDYLNSTTEIVVNFKNVSNVEVSEFHGEHGEGEEHKEDVIYLNNSGDSVRLKLNQSFVISYKAKEGYENENIIFTPSDEKKVVDINPYFSKSKLESILINEESNIQNVIKEKYNNIYLYNIQKGKLYNFGEWYGTTLQYIGDDYKNSDTLRVVLKKDHNGWIVKTNPPQIILNKFLYPNIPINVLSDTNSQKTQMLDKFTNPDTSHGSDGQ